MAKRQGDTIHHRSARWKDDIHATPDVSYISNPDVAHEHTDVAVAPIAKFVVGLFIFGVIVLGLVFAMFRFFDAREKTAEPQASPLARRGEERLPPEPRLQLAPGFGVRLEDGQQVDLSQGATRPELRIPQSEYMVVRGEWEKELKGYGWADEATGAVSIPIDEAMRRFVEQQKQQNAGQQQPGQPVGQPGAAQQPRQATEQLPASSSSGQTQEHRNQ